MGTMKEVRIAFIGCGGIAAKHSRGIQRLSEACIVAGQDVTEKQVEGLWRRTWEKTEPPAELPTAYTDMQKMLAETKPDAVVICTPHTLHYEHAMAALNAGCHVLMEKPMVTNAEHAHTLAAKVKETGLIFAIGYNTPCTPEFSYLRQLIRDEELGKLELVTGWLVQNWARATAGQWRQDPKLSGGGQAYDSGAHLLNSVCWTVESGIAEVFAFVDNHGTAVDVNSSINIRFDSGVYASITIGGNCSSEGAHLSYAFENGRVDIDGWGGSWIDVYKGRDKIKYPPITGESSSPIENFVDAVLGRAGPLTTPANGIVQSELMDAIYASAASGKPSKPTPR
jgi:predicted dehydrogenase